VVKIAKKGTYTLNRSLLLLDRRRHGALEVFAQLVGGGERGDSRHLDDFEIGVFYKDVGTEQSMYSDGANRSVAGARVV